MSKSLENKDDLFGKKPPQNITISGDRDQINVVNNSKGKTKEVVVVLLGILFLLIVLFVAYKLMFSEGKKEEVQVVVNTSDQEQWNHDSREDIAFEKAKSQYKSLQDAMKNKEKETEEEEAPKVDEKPKEEKPEDNVPVLDFGSFKQEESEKDLARKLQGGILLDENSIQFTPKEDPNKLAKSNQNQYESSFLRKGGANSTMLVSETFADGYAERSSINRDFLLSSGTSLSCVLKTKVVTSYNGLVLCQLSKDIYSANGKNLLVRRGAMLEGTQTEAVVQGASRVFITWAQIRDQDTIVRIDALGTDTLGASGVPAWIDTHFWKRFGNSLLLSFIDDALATATTHLQKNLNAENVTIDSMSSQGSNLAEIALENSINIEPTAYINQGTVISVIVPRNVDFSTVYRNVRVR